ncbi:MAG: acyl carrier protein [Clostridiales bacterium]|nr:acyl carrier protein [Clostridiales bacterium]MBR6484371.1 acyl carrier protein [Clostridiales bacterium]
MDDKESPRERIMTVKDAEERKDMIFEDVLKLLVQELGISPTEINRDVQIMEELNFDSLQMYELVIDLEEAYDIRLPDDLLETVKTVGDVVDLVYSRSVETEV